MAFKVNIGTKTGKTFKLETESPEIEGKELGQKIKGEDILPSLSGYEFEIKGASDLAGFTSMENVEGFALKKVLLGYGKGMHKRSKREGKKHRASFRPGGLRLRKTVRGKVLSTATAQINLKVIKEGHKHLSEIFPEQNKAPEKQAETPIAA